MARTLHDKLTRVIMLEVQFGDFGHWKQDQQYGRVYVSSGKQADDLDRRCQHAATAIIDLLIDEGLLVAKTER